MKNATLNVSEMWESQVMQAMGEASMCWHPRPEGEFDASNAEEVGKKVVEVVKEALQAAADQATERAAKIAEEALEACDGQHVDTDDLRCCEVRHVAAAIRAKADPDICPHNHPASDCETCAMGKQENS